MKQPLLLGLAVLMCGAGAVAQPRSASAPQKLLSAPVGLMAPVWSPDGKHIAVTSDNYTGIMVADADGSNLRIVTNAEGAGYKMTWNSESAIVGRTNIVEQGRMMHEMYSWNITNNKATLVMQKTRGMQAPTLRAAGLRRGALNIYERMMADPSHVADQVAALGQFSGSIIINPALSPDGNRVAFQVPGKGMWMINADGTNLRSLGKGSHPAWLPDNATIAYTVVTDNGDQYTSSTLVALNVDNGKSMTITSQPDMLPLTPAVSPDGSRVAFENAKDNAIYVVTLKY